MPDFYHFMNIYSPIDGPAYAMLEALGPDYRLSTPVKADPAPGVTPNSVETMQANGIVGVYVTIEAAMRKSMWPHSPMISEPMDQWLLKRKKL